jgi:hypothetical protein
MLTTWTELMVWTSMGTMYNGSWEKMDWAMSINGKQGVSVCTSTEKLVISGYHSGLGQDR